jgi:hypothetical protein
MVIIVLALQITLANDSEFEGSCGWLQVGNSVNYWFEIIAFAACFLHSVATPRLLN